MNHSANAACRGGSSATACVLAYLTLAAQLGCAPSPPLEVAGNGAGHAPRAGAGAAMPASGEAARAPFASAPRQIAPADARGAGAATAGAATDTPNSAVPTAGHPDLGASAEAHSASRRTPTAPEGMALVPAGPFRMGADDGGEPDEHPAHEVVLAAFWLDLTEVTNEAYDECVRAGACRAKDPRTGVFRRPRQPVTAVSWDDARSYCGWREKRLPTEAEFEKAVRGIDGRRFPWGNEPPTLERTVALGQPGPDDVGSRPAGRGPYGHHDLAGNVWEWVDDLYDPFAYQRAEAVRGVHGSCEQIMAALAQIERQGKKGYTGTNPIKSCERSIRGGAYNYPAEGLRASNRIHHPGTWRLRMTGLRCAKSVE